MRWKLVFVWPLQTPTSLLWIRRMADCTCWNQCWKCQLWSIKAWSATYFSRPIISSGTSGLPDCVWSSFILSWRWFPTTFFLANWRLLLSMSEVHISNAWIYQGTTYLFLQISILASVRSLKGDICSLPQSQCQVQLPLSQDRNDQNMNH